MEEGLGFLFSPDCAHELLCTSVPSVPGKLPTGHLSLPKMTLVAGLQSVVLIPPLVQTPIWLGKALLWTLS